MIRAVRANQTTFREVHFEPGFNVVLADRTRESTKKDTRNGLGKTTLVEIIHYCLGSTRHPFSRKKEALSGWIFSVDLEIEGAVLTASRAVDQPGHVTVSGNLPTWPISPTVDDRFDTPYFTNRTWAQVLGTLLFGLPIERETQYSPSFRSLFSYLVRRGRDAFSTPFEYFRKQKEWDKQVSNAFLIGMPWEPAAEVQRLKDHEKLLSDISRAADAGLMEGVFETVGELDAKRMRLEQRVARERTELASFEVHPQYAEIEKEANQITRLLHELANDNVRDRQLLSQYEESVADERPPSSDAIARLYEEARVDLPKSVVRRFDEVERFHTELISNRRSFLAEEITRLRSGIQGREEETLALSTKRATLLEILQAHGALDEFSRLQIRVDEATAELEEVKRRLADVRRFEEGKSSLRIEREMLHQRARREYDDSESARQKAVQLFNDNSEFLYSAPGNLIIDVAPKGYTFSVEIERSDSQGISSMKIFCYDLMLAQMWARRKPSPNLLIHDSTLFNGVDERQRALALELAASESASRGFQYICALNSDEIPQNEFSTDFDLDRYVRLRLTDEDVSGSLCGIRF